MVEMALIRRREVLRVVPAVPVATAVSMDMVGTVAPVDRQLSRELVPLPVASPVMAVMASLASLAVQAASAARPAPRVATPLEGRVVMVATVSTRLAAVVAMAGQPRRFRVLHSPVRVALAVTRLTALVVLAALVVPARWIQV
jgi:hypothetical protein